VGCDIHIYMERMIYTGTGTTRAWELAATEEACFDHRNYALFGVLAGVRGDGPPISLPRGLPADCSQPVREQLEDFHNRHSHTWFTLKDLLEYDWASHPERESCVSFLEWLVALQRASLSIANRPTEYRLVIAFDN
jgi:hypothetical protein